MSSGTLPLSTYHRAQSLGEGTYGSVLAVYNEDGEEYALKLFLDDEEEEDDDEEEEEDEGEENQTDMDLGALREISALRLLRDENGHENIVPMVDVKSAVSEEEVYEDGEYGAGTEGCLGMAMPLYQCGTLGDGIDSGKLHSRKQKVKVAHGLLCAVAYLHDNGIIHRDIKADNVMLEQEDEGEGNIFRPILIDFSLAKIVNGAMYGQTGDHSFRMDGSDTKEPTHTGEVGTVTYQAPEVVQSKPYGLPSDLWSVGVILLEVIRNKTLEVNKNKQAEKMISDALEELPDQPFPNLVRGLLTKDPEKRLTARDALKSPVFAKFGMVVPPVRMIDVALALPFDDEEDEEEDENSHPNNGTKKNNSKKKDTVLRKRQNIICRICRDMEYSHPMTKHAALAFSEQMFQLDDMMDDLSESQSLLDCIVLAAKFYEAELPDLNDLNEKTIGSFKNWSIDEYIDNETTIWMMMDHCLYPRVMDKWEN